MSEITTDLVAALASKIYNQHPASSGIQGSPDPRATLPESRATVPESLPNDSMGLERITQLLH